MRALFEVGEEVILCSKACPELNGDTRVLLVEVLSKPATTVLGNKESVKYRLDVDTSNLPTDWFAQSALRKKHKGSDFSFDEIVNEIKSKKPIEV